jgi:hypothetical protein
LRGPFIFRGVLAAGVPFEGGAPLFPVSPFWLLTACLATLKVSVDVEKTLALDATTLFWAVCADNSRFLALALRPIRSFRALRTAQLAADFICQLVSSLRAQK